MHNSNKGNVTGIKENAASTKKNTSVFSEVMRYVRCVIFIAIIIALVYGIDFLFVPWGYIRFAMHEVKSSDSEKGYDTIFIGASHGRTSFDPEQFDTYEMSKDSFNFCIPGQNVDDSYYLVKEACRHNDVKTVIFEYDYQYWSDHVLRNYGDRFIYSWLPMSEVKLEYIARELPNLDFRTTFSKRWAYVKDSSLIKNNIKVKTDSSYWNYDLSTATIKDAGGPYKDKGFFYREVNTGKGDYYAAKWNPDNIYPDAVTYFKDMVTYCKKNDIELICVTAPIAPYVAVHGPSRDANAYFAKLCEEQGVTYIDFNLADLTEFPRVDKEFVDWDGHMVGQLAERFSRVVAMEINHRRGMKHGDHSYGFKFYESYDEYKEDLYRINPNEDKVPEEQK